MELQRKRRNIITSIDSKIKDVNEDQFLNWTKVIKNKNDKIYLPYNDPRRFGSIHITNNIAVILLLATAKST